MRHIFITGFWRSGTSLLLRLFDGHPQVYAMPHMTGLITMLEKYPDFLDTLRRCHSPHQLLALLGHHSVVSNFRHIIKASFEGMSFTDDGIRYPFSFDFAAFAERFLACLQAGPTPGQAALGYYEAIRQGWTNCRYRHGQRVFARHQGHRNYLYPGEDTVRFVLEHIPDMEVVELIRDPVYQIGSALRASPGLGVDEAIVQWTFAYNRARNSLERPCARYELLRYEDLVGDIERVMRHLADRLGIAFDPCLLTPTFNTEPWGGNSQFTRHKALEARTDPGLTQAQLDTVRRALAPERRRLGYADDLGRDAVTRG